MRDGCLLRNLTKWFSFGTSFTSPIFSNPVAANEVTALARDPFEINEDQFVTPFQRLA